MDLLTTSRIAAVAIEYGAFIAALCTYRYHDKAFRLMFYLLLFIVIFESVEAYVSLFCSRETQLKLLVGTNIYIPVETLAIYFLGFKAVNNRVFHRAISLSTILFFLYWILNIYFNGSISYPTAPVLLYAINGLVIFLGLLILQSDSRAFFKQPIFYLSLGMIIFYGCTMPYFCVVKYFDKVDIAALRKLFQILAISCYIRYSLTAVAYIVLYRQQKKIKLQAPITRDI